MISKTRNMMDKLKGNQGFTLVEMALVLIIIGIIIGAVVKGGDLVRSAEQKRIYSKFLSEWRLAYLNFYDRTGKILGDTWDTTLTTPGAGQDGLADTAGSGGGGAVSDAGRDALINSTSTSDYLGLSEVGLESPVSNIPGTPWQYKYVDSTGTTHLLDIAFDYNAGNYMLINNMPAELGLAIDTMIDGQADATAGSFIITGGGTAWPTTPSTDTNVVEWRMKF